MNLLALLLLVPMIGAVACAAMPKPKGARQLALFFSLGTLLISLIAAARFFSAPHEAPTDLGYTGASVDAISMWLILLTTALQPLAIAASFDSIRDRQKEYYAWMMALQVAMLGVFVARDVLLFYVFFELTLIPMFFIIGIWGGP